MATASDHSFPHPDVLDPGSVWADRVSERSLIGRNQRGVQIPIGKGEGEISPGELLKLALIGCAGMSADIPLARRLGEDFPMRLWAHGTADGEQDRYLRLEEEVQLDLSGLGQEEIARVIAVFERTVAAACTVERTIVPGVEVTHRVTDPAQATHHSTAEHFEAEEPADR